MSEKQPGEQHHDGIEEHDNHMPNWWLLTLFGSIAFSLVYWTYYHTLAAGAPQAQELAQDEAALAALRNKSAPAVSDQVLTDASRDKEAVARGEGIYQTNCVACHGVRAEGSVGPNLTDDYWLHGGKPMQIYAVVRDGVTEKGMLAWGAVLGESKVKDVTAFVVSLRGTNVPGKAPQGEKDGGEKAPAPATAPTEAPKP